MLLAVQLGSHALLQEPILLQLQEDVLGNLGLELRCGAAEDIKADVEPLIYLSMNRVVFVAEFLWCALLCQGLCLRCGAVLIRP